MTLYSIDIAENEAGTTEPVAPVVYTKDQWQHAWTLEPLLNVKRLTLTTGEKDSQAVLASNFGRMKPQGFDGFTSITGTSLIRKFVKIEFTPTRGDAKTWVGVIVAAQTARHGATDTTTYGDFSYVAYGLEWFLRRYQVLQSYSSLANGTIKTVPVGLPFNAGGGNAGDASHPSFGNMRKPTNAVARFDENDANNEQWTARDLLQYLEYWHQPWQTGGLIWSIYSPILQDLDWNAPKNIPTHARTLREIIDQVVDKRRGLNYSWEYDLGSLQLKLHPVFEDDIVLPSGETIRGNPRVLSVSMASKRRSPAIEWQDHTSKYEQVIVQGARKTRTMTLSPLGGKVSGYSLVQDWTTAEKDAYFTAATGVAGYADMDGSRQELFNEALWKANPLRRVFTHFKISSDKPWKRGVQVSLTTPLVEGVDYSLQPPASTSVGFRQYKSNLSYIQFADRYISIDGSSGTVAANEEIDTNGLRFDCHVSEYENKRGVMILPSAPGHVIAFYDVFFGPSLPTTAYEAQTDYRTAKITLTVEENDRLTEVWPVQADPPINNCSSKQIINLGDDIRQDYLEPSTVVGIEDDGSLIQSAYGGYIRDDSTYARDVARLAYEWYKTERQSIRFEVNYITTEMQQGDLIAGIVYEGAVAVNTVISAVTFDFDSQQTSINTDLAEELDFRALAIR